MISTLSVLVDEVVSGSRAGPCRRKSSASIVAVLAQATSAVNPPARETFAGRGQDGRVVEDRLRTAATLTNWDHDQMVDVVQHYVEQAHNTPRRHRLPAAGAREVRLGRQQADLQPRRAGRQRGPRRRMARSTSTWRSAAEASDGTNALPAVLRRGRYQRFGPIQRDPRFQLLLNASTNSATAKTKLRTKSFAAPTNAPPKTPAPAKPLPPDRQRAAAPSHHQRRSALRAKKPKAE